MHECTQGVTAKSIAGESRIAGDESKQDGLEGLDNGGQFRSRVSKKILVREGAAHGLRQCLRDRQLVTRHAVCHLAGKPIDADLRGQCERDEVAVRIVRTTLERVAPRVVDPLRDGVRHRRAQIPGTAPAMHRPPHRHGPPRDVAQRRDEVVHQFEHMAGRERICIGPGEIICRHHRRVLVDDQRITETEEPRHHFGRRPAVAINTLRDPCERFGVEWGERRW